MMVEVSAEVGLGEEEIELDLALSIGGSLRRHEKPRPNSKPVGFQSDLLEHSQHDGNKHKKKRWMMRECDEAEEHQRGGMSKRDRVTGIIGGGSVVQNVVFNNGFAFPCWAVVGKEKKNVVGSLAPAACSRGFQPFLVQRNGGGLEHNDERNAVDASSMCSSSVVLEQQSTSHEGGGSSDSHSHSVHTFTEPTQLNSSNKENNTRSKPEQCASSHPAGTRHGKLEGRNNIVNEMQPKNIPRPTKLKEEATVNSKAAPIHRPLSNENSSNGPLKETKTDMGKPPKPHSQTSSLPQMPYVSTTGNGPNGKTVNGFLYKYTKTEVSIVCVCHGSTFSPAEFVQHAGGTDIAHPLRHITVIPSAFG